MEDNTEVYDLLVKKLGFPTMTFILFAKEAALTKRLKNRQNEDKDLRKVELAKDKYAKMQSFCEKYRMPHLLIDTSYLSPDEVVSIILANLKGVVSI